MFDKDLGMKKSPLRAFLVSCSMVGIEVQVICPKFLQLAELALDSRD